MELIVFILVVAVLSIGFFWIAGTIYGVLRSPMMYFPVSLAAKMAACAVVGGLFFVVGAVILPTMIFNFDMMKRPNYQQWSTIIIGAIISLIGVVIIYFSTIMLAWEILD